jgi:hypothetical protein
MWLFSYRFHCVIIVIISALTVLAMFHGEAYADILLDHTSGVRPDILSKEALANLPWRRFADPLIGIYLYPPVSVFLAYRFARTRLVFIVIALLFLWAELYAIGGGGDLKGCEECGLSLFFYGLGFPLLYPLIMGIALGVQFFRAPRQPIESARKLDNVLVITVALFSLLMLGVLWRYVGW